MKLALSFSRLLIGEKKVGSNGMDNPLLPPDNKPSDDGYVLPAKKDPVSPGPDRSENAAEIIRAKVARIYAEEPDARKERAEADTSRHRSRHQQYMHELSTSGKDLAAIQTEWHNYYIALSPEEKRQVWQEFYESNANASDPGFQLGQRPAAEKLAANKNSVAGVRKTQVTKRKQKSPDELRQAIRSKVSSGSKLTMKHHLQSLLFGLGVGLVAVIIFMFGFFNEFILAPFIQPSRHAVAAPLIIDPNGVAPTANPEVIIPKINAEIPVDYSQTSIDETVIENALEDGVVHYPTTTLPGETGNTAFFGHSSNNIFSPGKYKFAFVLLHELVPGDTFYLTKDGKVYVYKVFSRTIVDPSDVGVLDPVPGHSATATLITCDPPGTSWRRLVVVGDQVSPDPATNTKGDIPVNTSGTVSTTLPGNGQTLWGRWWDTAYGKVVTVVAVVGFIVLLWRWVLAIDRRG